MIRAANSGDSGERAAAPAEEQTAAAEDQPGSLAEQAGLNDIK